MQLEDAERLVDAGPAVEILELGADDGSGEADQGGAPPIKSFTNHAMPAQFARCESRLHIIDARTIGQITI